MRDGIGRFKRKQKRHRGLNGENMDESPARLVKRKLLENASTFKAVASDQPRQEQWRSLAGTIMGLETQRQFGCLAVSSQRKSGGLALIWREGVRVMARDTITSIWSNEEGNLLEKMELIRDKLGPWQYQCYRKMKNNIKGLRKEISRLMDGPTSERSTSLLKNARYGSSKGSGDLWAFEELFQRTLAYSG
ncbi:hypothetical protein GOBAR_DD34886 [Gossypium barbadense]|nr:hypothetical protein GOBAR_DD34886 [Gossypium barbadense]